MKVEYDKTGTLRACCDGHPPIIVLECNGARPSHMGDGFSQDGVMYTLNTIEKHSVCYAIEGNVVDRVSAKNGKGWCEDVSPTLNTQDKHAVCYAVYDARGNSVGGGWNHANHDGRSQRTCIGLYDDIGDER